MTRNFYRSTSLSTLVALALGSACAADDSTDHGTDSSGGASGESTESDGGHRPAGAAGYAESGSATGGRSFANGGALGDAGDGASAGGANADGSDDSGDCDVYLDNPGEKTVTIRITNSTDAALHLGAPTNACSSVPFYTVTTDDSGTTGIPPCALRCGDAQSGQLPCGPECPFQPLLRLEPGASHDFEWRAVLVEELTMPAGCHADSATAQTTCLRESAAPDYLPYTVSAVAWTDWHCASGDCECVGDDRSCIFSGEALVRGRSFSVHTNLDLRVSEFVALVFEPQKSSESSGGDARDYHSSIADDRELQSLDAEERDTLCAEQYAWATSSPLATALDEAICRYMGATHAQDAGLEEDADVVTACRQYYDGCLRSRIWTFTSSCPEDYAGCSATIAQVKACTAGTRNLYLDVFPACDELTVQSLPELLESPWDTPAECESLEALCPDVYGVEE